MVCAVLGDLGWVKSHDKSGSPKATRVFYGRCDEVLDNWREVSFTTTMGRYAKYTKMEFYPFYMKWRNTPCESVIFAI